MKTLPIYFTAAVLSLASSQTCNGIPETFLFDYSRNPVAIPDGSLVGISLPGIVDVLSFNSIRSLTVNLDISGRGPAGGWNGDLYASLFHDGELVVLLNRPGVNSLDEIGYGDSGMRVTLSDDVTTSIQTYRQSPNGGVNPPLAAAVGGTWSPATPLSGFNGLNPDGQWTLFVADADTGGLSQVSGWSLTIDGATVIPDAATTWLLLLAGLSLLGVVAYSSKPLARFQRQPTRRNGEPS